jgi:transcriptional regulator with XRE-family HTH domain
MRLADYLKKHGLSDKDFAEKTGLHYTEVWNYRTGRRMPRADKVAAIEKATRGAVRAGDFTRAA